MIEPMLVLSTAHLREQTCNGWLTVSPFVAYAKADYGWFIPVPENVPDNVPTELRACFALARSRSCAWVMFDRDADTVLPLPVYAW